MSRSMELIIGGAVAAFSIVGVPVFAVVMLRSGSSQASGPAPFSTPAPHRSKPGAARTRVERPAAPRRLERKPEAARAPVEGLKASNETKDAALVPAASPAETSGLPGSAEDQVGAKEEETARRESAQKEPAPSREQLAAEKEISAEPIGEAEGAAHSRASKEETSDALAVPEGEPAERKATGLVERAQDELGPEKELTNSIGMQFVLTPAGEFTAGSEKEAAEERPQAATTEGPVAAQVPGEHAEAPVDQPARAGEEGVTEPARTVEPPRGEESGVLTLRRAHVPGAASRRSLRPSISSPSAGQAAVDRNPTVTAGAFSDPEADAHSSSDWDIFEDAGLTFRVASSLNDGTNLTSIVVNAASVTFEGSLAGETALAPSTEYWVRVRYRDQAGAASDWSNPRHFATAASQMPSESPTTALDGAKEAPLPSDEAEGEELDPLLGLLASVQTGRALYEDQAVKEDQPETDHTSEAETVAMQDEEGPLPAEETWEEEGRGSFRSGLGARFGMSVYPHVTTADTEARLLRGVYCHFAETASRRFEFGLDLCPSAIEPEEDFYYLLRLDYLRYMGKRGLSYWMVGCGGIKETLYEKDNVFGFAEVGIGNARLLGMEAIDARIACQIPFGSNINSVLVVLVAVGCEF